MRISISIYTAIIIFLLGLLIINVAYAEGTEYVGSVPMNCTDPTTREDGTAIEYPVSVKFFLTDTVTDLPPPEEFTPVHTELMSNGCESRVYNGSNLESGKQYYKIAVAYERGEVSRYSEFAPFTFRLSPPLPPVITE